MASDLFSDDPSLYSDVESESSHHRSRTNTSLSESRDPSPDAVPALRALVPSDTAVSGPFGRMRPLDTPIPTICFAWYHFQSWYAGEFGCISIQRHRSTSASRGFAQGSLVHGRSVSLQRQFGPEGERLAAPLSYPLGDGRVISVPQPFRLAAFRCHFEHTFDGERRASTEWRTIGHEQDRSDGDSDGRVSSCWVSGFRVRDISQDQRRDFRRHTAFHRRHRLILADDAAEWSCETCGRRNDDANTMVCDWCGRWSVKYAVTWQ